jgi:RNA polymerase sigma-70 factor (ECF subfamily)
MTEQTILVGCLNNDPSAQRELYNRYSPKMLSVCYRFSNSREDAEDMLQEGFIKIFTQIHTFQNKGAFEGWIRRVMINECISFIRVQKKVKFIEDENYFEERHNNIESQFSVEDIQFLIDSLPDGYRMIFNLYAIEGYKHHEIATMLSISEGTSKSQLSHARKMLQENIAKLKNYENGTE